MEIVYVYQKRRRDFGRQPLFSERPPELHVSIPCDPAYAAENCYERCPISVETQAAREMSEHEVNTESFVLHNKGLLHLEGGWPKDVDCSDVEHTMRYRRKAEKDEEYAKQVRSLEEVASQCIKQNVAINIYNEYFTLADCVAFSLREDALAAAAGADLGGGAAAGGGTSGAGGGGVSGGGGGAAGAAVGAAAAAAGAGASGAAGAAGAASAAGGAGATGAGGGGGAAAGGTGGGTGGGSSGMAFAYASASGMLLDPPSAKTLNVYRDPHPWKRPASCISWFPEDGHKIAIAYSMLEFQKQHSDASGASSDASSSVAAAAAAQAAAVAQAAAAAQAAPVILGQSAVIGASGVQGSASCLSHAGLRSSMLSLAAESEPSYIWDIENPNSPDQALIPSSPLVCIKYNPKDPHILVGGSYSGVVACWDTRKGPFPSDCSAIEKSHRDPVYCVQWVQSKTGSEFFSTSTDGLVMWWDIRKLSEPTETLLLDAEKNGVVVGGTVLDFESTMPTKFMVGTEAGQIFMCNKKAKTPADRISSVISGHYGPLRALQRNPFFTKNYLTVGDWTAKVWSEDVKTSLMSTCTANSYITDACWSPVRPSVFLTGNATGVLEVWDCLARMRSPALSVQVSGSPLTAVKIQEHGRLVATSAVDGSTTILELGDSLARIMPGEKALFGQMFERELKREKTLESAAREKRLKTQQQQQQQQKEQKEQKDHQPAQTAVKDVGLFKRPDSAEGLPKVPPSGIPVLGLQPGESLELSGEALESTDQSFQEAYLASKLSIDNDDEQSRFQQHQGGGGMAASE